MVLRISDDQLLAWQQDGVICLRDVLSLQTLEKSRTLFEWSKAHPGPNSFTKIINGAEQFQDRANPHALDAYGQLSRQPEFREILTELWGEGGMGLIFEQIFSRNNGPSPLTPWHQDTLYMPTRGDQLATVWFSLQGIPKDSALEFVAGSHRGAIYNGIKAHPDQGTVPLYDRADMPPLPDIAAQRGEWQFLSWATEPGDALVFHPSILHGGGANSADVSRQTITLRFFGDDVTVADLGDAKVYRCSKNKGDPDYHPITAMYHATPGSPFRHPDFPSI